MQHMNIIELVKVVIYLKREENSMYCIYHEISKGDTLYSISRRYKVELSAIIKANPFINVYNLKIGDVICLPLVPRNNYTNYTTYLVREGDTLGSIVAENEINLADLLENNNIDSISLMPGTTLTMPIVGSGQVTL